MIRLTNLTTRQVLDISPGTLDEFAFLSLKLRPKGLRVEYFGEPQKIGIASGRRFPAEDRPPLTPFGEELHGETVRLEQFGQALDRCLDADLARQIRRTPRA